jgi:hypothetical protein
MSDPPSPTLRRGRHRTRRDPGNGATGVSDMAGKAARVAVEPSGSERDTMELLGEATHLRRDFGVPGIEHVAIGYRAGRRQRS